MKVNLPPGIDSKTGNAIISELKNEIKFGLLKKYVSNISDFFVSFDKNIASRNPKFSGGLFTEDGKILCKFSMDDDLRVDVGIIATQPNSD